MQKIEQLPNTGKILVLKLNNIGITNKQELVEMGSENELSEFYHQLNKQL